MADPTGFSESGISFSAVRQAQANLGPDGRVLIPAALREAAGMERGDKVILRVEDGRIVIETFASQIRRSQALFRQYNKGVGSIVDEFLAERRTMWGEKD